MTTEELVNKKTYYYDLPEELIAQDPLEKRDESRLLVLDRNNGELEHKVFKNIIDYLRPNDCLVINNLDTDNLTNLLYFLYYYL